MIYSEEKLRLEDIQNTLFGTPDTGDRRQISIAFLNHMSSYGLCYEDKMGGFTIPNRLIESIQKDTTTRNFILGDFKLTSANTFSTVLKTVEMVTSCPLRSSN